MTTPVIIVGAGGHGAVVADALLCAGVQVLGFTDADPRRKGELVCGLPVLGDDRLVLGRFSKSAVRLVNGIGGVRGESLRRDVQRFLEAQGWRFADVRHPTATVSRFAALAEGVQLLAGCVVQANAKVARGCIVNTAAVVEHDVCLGEYVHVAPRAVVCGAVRVGAGSYVGAGAVLRQGVRLDEGTIVGAGAVLIRNAGGGVWTGVPARPLKRNDEQ